MILVIPFLSLLGLGPALQGCICAPAPPKPTTAPGTCLVHFEFQQSSAVNILCGFSSSHPRLESRPSSIQASTLTSEEIGNSKFDGIEVSRTMQESSELIAYCLPTHQCIYARASFLGDLLQHESPNHQRQIGSRRRITSKGAPEHSTNAQFLSLFSRWSNT